MLNNIVNNWIKDNRLLINYSKSNFLIFNKTKKKYNFSIKIDKFELIQVSQTKYLGVLIDDKLN